VVDNSTGFDDKIKRVVNGICQSIGAIPSRPERKFLVENFVLPENTHVERFDIETIIIPSETSTASYQRAIRRTQGGNSSYLITSSHQDECGKRIIESRNITAREYMTYKNSRAVILAKKIAYFIWKGQYYALNEYTSAGITTLEVETETETETDDAAEIVPPFIQVVKEVTDNPLYSTEGLAQAIM
jgi:hypothetical protein